METKVMGKSSTGIRFLEAGAQWRKLWLSGTSIDKISQIFNEHPQVIRRSIWLAKIPDDIKSQIKSNPEIFTRGILVDTFAAKRRQCEKNGFSLLRSEVTRLIAAGAGTQPKLKKTCHKIKKQTKQNLSAPSVEAEPNIHANPLIDIGSTIEAEYRIKQALGYACRVAFDKSGGGEVRIFFKDKKSLEGLIETFEPFSKDLF
jgi:hypothetical protein